MTTAQTVNQPKKTTAQAQKILTLIEKQKSLEQIQKKFQQTEGVKWVLGRFERIKSLLQLAKNTDALRYGHSLCIASGILLLIQTSINFGTEWPSFKF